MPRESAGTLYYEMVLDSAKFIRGALLTKTELKEIKQVAAEAGLGFGKFGSQFEKLTRLARDAKHGLHAASVAFGQTAAKSDQAAISAARYVRGLRDTAKKLEAQAGPFRILTEGQKQHIATLRRTATAFEEQIVVQRKLRQEQDRLTVSTKKQKTAMSAVQKQVLALARQITFIAFAYKALRTVQTSVSAALELERQRLAFEVFMGDARLAARTVEDIRNLAARTPLTTESTLQAARTLLQYGVAGREVTTLLKQLGDVSGGSHEQLQRLALAMGQITANSRLQGQELRQLIEAGFNPLKVISDETGQSMMDLRIEMAKGRISAEQVREALEKATSEGGRFFRLLDRQAEETAFGKIQVLRGQIRLLQEDLAKLPTSGFGELAEQIGHAIEGLRLMGISPDLRHEATTIGEKGFTGLGFMKLLARQALGVTDAVDVMGKMFDVEGQRAAAYAEENKEIEQAIANLEMEYEILLDGKDAVMLRRFEEEKLHSDLIKRLKLAMRLKEEEEAFRKSVGKAGPFRQRVQRELQAEQLGMPTVELREQLAALQSHIEQRDQAELHVLGQIAERGLSNEEADKLYEDTMGNFLTRAEAKDRAQQLTKEFVDSKVAEIVESNLEAAATATAGSREEFDIIRQIESSRLGLEHTKEQKEQARHDAAQEVRNLMREEFRIGVESLRDLFPEPL